MEKIDEAMLEWIFIVISLAAMSFFFKELKWLKILSTISCVWLFVLAIGSVVLDGGDND